MEHELGLSKSEPNSFFLSELRIENRQSPIILTKIRREDINSVKTINIVIKSHRNSPIIRLTQQWNRDILQQYHGITIVIQHNTRKCLSGILLRIETIELTMRYSAQAYRTIRPI